jgi:hypothetical protein
VYKNKINGWLSLFPSTLKARKKITQTGSSSIVRDDDFPPSIPRQRGREKEEEKTKDNHPSK